MKSNLRYFNDIYSTTYLSPFPRYKSNNQVISSSNTKKISENKAIIDIPPSVTKSYMLKNPFYFDLKKHKDRFKCKKRPQSSKGNYIKKKIISPVDVGHVAYDGNKLDDLLNNNNKFKVKPRLNKNLEEISCSKIQPMKDRPKLSSSEVLKILYNMKLPSPPIKEKFTGIPKYIDEFRIREMIEKEYERLVEEEKCYPHGSYKIWEDDRLLILTNLNIIRDQLLEELMKFPVDYYLRSIGIINRRREVEKRLDEIEYASKLFALTDVFLKY